MADAVDSVGQNQQEPHDATLDLLNNSQVQSKQIEIASPKDGADNILKPGNPRSPGLYMSAMGDSQGGHHPPSISVNMGPAGDAPSVDSPRERSGTDTQSVDTGLSAVSGDSKGDSLTSSRPTSAASSRSPLHKENAAKREKEKEKEERVRRARERMAEERKKKLEELKEQQRVAQENREKQLEMRRRKIEELRRRESERRAAVEDRRRKKEDIERARRESIIQKAQERVARYEQWKSGGRKGGSGHIFGFGSRTPRDICQPVERPRRSSSHSALVRRSPNGSDSDYVRPQRRALSACSTVRRHCCIDINRYVPSASPPQRPKSTMMLNTTVKMRENKSPRKPRPASVASSMPSFVPVQPDEKPSPRSKSTDRLSRADKPKPRPPRRVSHPPDSDRKKTNEEDRNKENKNIDKDNADKDSDKSANSVTKFSRRSVDRLATPKFVREKPVATSAETNGKTESATPPKPKPAAKEKPLSKEAPATTPPLVVEEMLPAMSKSATEVLSKSSIDVSKSPQDVMSKSTQDISVEEYKAKMAEKRRQAREKAEKEAEMERQRLEEERRVEEECQRQEEEEQRRQEEEANRLAAEARRLEEERLQKAIEAEEQRKQEEEERLEQERIAKEEAERKAKEEAERMEKERVERKQKEEEERLARKKRLEMIMKRVKTDGTESPKTQSPAKSATSSPSKSGDSSTESSAEEMAEETMTTTVTSSGSSTTIITTTILTTDKALEDSSGDLPSTPRGGSPRGGSPLPYLSADRQGERLGDGSETPKFRSPLLQQLVESKSSENLTSERPKFKSPLLQSLLGKNKGGIRKSEDKIDAEEKKDGVGFDSAFMKIEKCLSDSETSDTSPENQKYNSVEKEKLRSSEDEEKDIDTSEEKQVSKEGLQDSADENSEEIPLDKEVTVSETPHMYISGTNMTDSEKIVHSSSDSGFQIQDSGILIDLGTSSSSLGQHPVNGLAHNGETHDACQDLVDSSISMKSVESICTSVTDGMTGSSKELISSQNDFEEIIDLSMTNKNLQLKSNVQENKGDHSEDLLNFNNIEGAEDEINRTPLIAFEGNATSRQDVTDLLS